MPGPIRVTQHDLRSPFNVMTIFIVWTLPYPDRMEDCASYEDNFRSRRGSFNGVLAPLPCIDTVDTVLKESTHFASFGLQYPLRPAVLSGLAIGGIFVARRTCHLTFALRACGAEIWWIFSRFRFLD